MNLQQRNQIRCTKSRLYGVPLTNLSLFLLHKIESYKKAFLSQIWLKRSCLFAKSSDTVILQWILRLKIRSPLRCIVLYFIIYQSLCILSHRYVLIQMIVINTTAYWQTQHNYMHFIQKWRQYYFIMFKVVFQGASVAPRSSSVYVCTSDVIVFIKFNMDAIQ